MLFVENFESSKALVMMILSPDYLINFAYLTLVWQMHSFHNSGFVDVLKQASTGDIMMIILSTLLFMSQLSLSFLFITDVIEMQLFIKALSITNLILPSLVVLSVLYLNCRFSGVPKREEYKSRLKFMHWAIGVWSVTRITRAILGVWDTSVFQGMLN